MSVSSVRISLHASRKDGRGTTNGEFLTPLNIRAGEVGATFADGGEWAAGIVNLAIVRQHEFDHIDSTDPGAPTEAFFAAIIDAFRAAGQFLDRRSPQVLSAMRDAGLSLRIFVDIRMDQDQFEVEFPPEFLSACGR